MTTRVIECHGTPHRPDVLATRPATAARKRSRAELKTATLVAMLVVPVAGAAEAPAGWIAAGIAAVATLCFALPLGHLVRWGWLTLLFAVAGVALPRGQWQALGPALFVATALCGTLWLTNSRAPRRSAERRPQPGSSERAAQVTMGFSGERYVGHLLARDLPEDYVLINGLKLPCGSGDVDHVVVGPTGLFLMETKTMAGRIVCETNGTWSRTRVGRGGTTYDAYVGDPAAQVQRNIFAVRECLRRRLPRLFRNAPLWINGLIVFPHPDTELQTEHSRIPAVLAHEVTQRICTTAPSRPLSPTDVAAVVASLLDEVQLSVARAGRRSAQALIEIALLLPVVLALAFGTVAISRVVQAQTAVVAVAHEAARAGALARSPSDAIDRMRQRAALVAPGLGLNPATLIVEWDVTRFAQDPGEVVTVVRYPVDFADLPLVGWTPTPIVRAEHAEWIDPSRSGVPVDAVPPE